MGDTLIVGLGNPILSDDGIGWRVARALRDAALDDSVDIREACVGGLTLAEMFVGYRHAVVIDAIMTQNGVPGTVYHVKLANLPGTLNTASAHDTNLVTALRALRRFGAAVPPDDAIDIVAVEVQDVWTFAEQCTPAVEDSVPNAVSAVLDLFEGAIQGKAASNSGFPQNEP